MRKSHLLAVSASSVAVVAVVLGVTLNGSLVVAQQQQPTRTAMRPAQAAPVIKLLDVSFIFKNHARFKAMMDEMKASVTRAEAQVRSEREAIRGLAEQLKQFHSGTPDYKALEAEITRRNTDLSVQIQLQKKEFLQREAKIYHDIYQEIQQEVNYYCAAQGVAVVLRFSREPADVEKPESVLGYINKDVVTYARDLDITDIILQQLNHTQPNPTRPNQGNLGSRPRQGVSPRM